ncbi:MAG: hypothetical protein WCE68_08070 [Anaerolineales bacterium]
MLDEGNNVTLDTPEAPPPEESNNRTFLIVAGVFAALIFLTLVCGAVYVLGYLPSQTAKQKSTLTAIAAGNSQQSAQATSTAQAALWTPTSPPTFTPTSTDTPVSTNALLGSPTASPVIAITAVPATVTPTTDLAAMQTQLAAQMTSTEVAGGGAGTPGALGTLGALGTPATPGTPTGMPRTGYFDQVGLPGLVILTLALVAVIFLARRLRNTPSK